MNHNQIAKAPKPSELRMFHGISASRVPTSKQTLLAKHLPSLKVNKRASWKLARGRVIALHESVNEIIASGILVDVNYDEC